jgi:hypothetical protein
MSLSFNNLIPLLNRDVINRNKITWIYSFCNKFLENIKTLDYFRNFVQPNDPITSSPLLYQMNMGIVLLIAGLINNKSDILLSISQSIRSTL